MKADWLQYGNESHLVPTDEFDKVLNINLKGYFLCAKVRIGPVNRCGGSLGLLPLNHRPAFQKGIAHFQKGIAHFLSRPGGGSIVFDSSVHQIIPKPTYLGYACSKAAIGHMTSTLALEYAGNDQISAHSFTKPRDWAHCLQKSRFTATCALQPHTNLSTQPSPHKPLPSPATGHRPNH